jgi:hypothetical protein
LFYFSLVGSVVLFLAAAQRSSDARYLASAAAWLPASLLLTKLPLLVVTRLTPHTMDTLLDLRFERQVWLWVSAHPDLNLLCNVAYTALPVAIALGIATSTVPRAAVRAMLEASVIAALLYVVFPAEGPRAYALHLTGAAHNCVPSLHVTWAALAAAFAGKRLRPALWLFVAVTATVTITTGEHYLIDVLAAAPLILFCLWANQPVGAPATHTERPRAYAAGYTATAA